MQPVTRLSPDETNATPKKVENPSGSVALRTSHLTKQYGAFTALSDLSLEVESGAIYGLIGPTGAGKTTLLRILATLQAPSSGEAWIYGRSLNDLSSANLRQVRAGLGYMPDFIGLYERITIHEYLEFFAAAYKIERPARARLIADLLALVDLAGRRDDYIETLPYGLSQRLGLARTLIHDPQILLLDEPANGLEPQGRIELRELLRELSRLGKTVFFSSHLLNELTEICTHVGLLERGRLLTGGPVSQLLQSFRQDSKVIRLRLRPVVSSTPEQIYRLLLAAPRVQRVQQLYGYGEWEIQLQGQDYPLQDLWRYLMLNNVPVFSFEEYLPTLADIFQPASWGYVP